MSTKPSGTRGQDPFLDREAGRYERPLPSREFILQVLAQLGVPATLEQLSKLLEVKPEEASPFVRRLDAMERAGQIMRNRRGAILIPDKLDLVRGKVMGHAEGFGFLRREDGGTDLYLSPREMRGVMHGDRVLARPGGVDRRGRNEATVVEVLERANRRLVGRVHTEHKLLFVSAEDRRISQDIWIVNGETRGAKPGQVVQIELIEHPTRDTPPFGKVVEVVGDYGAPGMEIEIALRKHDLPFEFGAAVERVAARLPDEVLKKDLKARRDLRDLPLVTIDGETARDFDDAVYAEPIADDTQEGAFRLIVAIADVSHYVKATESIDKEALLRGTSVYFPRRVIPMLPEKLSNGLCSLNPEVDRLTVACDMRIGVSGDVLRYEFYTAVIRSHARLTYTEVAAVLADPSGPTAQARRPLVPHLQVLERVFRRLLQAREVRGAIDFETSETQIEFDDQGKIASIHPSSRNDAHRLIEECMLAANVCASDFLTVNQHPTLYRVHEGPTPEKLKSLREFLKPFGLRLDGAERPQTGDYARLLETIRARPDFQLLQTVMLRSLSQAVYSPVNEGHFGLAYEGYTHFTSPIRRYPDLLVHRAIKAVLAGVRFEPGDWAILGQHCSETERRADEASRDVEQWLKCYFMQERVDEEFDGTIAAVTPFGLFVGLDQLYVEGLVHVSELAQDYFHHDPSHHRLVGERTGVIFRLGDRVRVAVSRVDLEKARIDFRLIGSLHSGRARKSKSRPGKESQ